MSTSFHLQQLTPSDVALMRALNELFGEAFEEPDTYAVQPPSDTYVQALLAKEHVIVLVALVGRQLAGGLVAYELEKFERARRELYIYDLAVAQEHRRHGIATALIQRLREIAAQRDAWTIYVQADYGDEPALALYGKLGTREEVLHYDLDVPGNERGGADTEETPGPPGSG